jgi:phospholipid-binding lipoprotein MlaA
MKTARISILIATALLSGCASNQPPPESRVPHDPWEPLNRPIHSVNTGFDRVLLRPLAKGYEIIVPSFMRRGVTNFSRNLRTPLTAINNLLQGKGAAATNDAGRFLVNSTFGVLGIFDFATPAGFDFNEEDFGQTFAVWGVPAGPYVVIPVLGPRTLSEAFAIPLNFLADPLFHYRNSSARDRLYALRTIDVRQRLFAADELLKDSTDRYITIRESYLQRRQYLIYDGNPPVDDDFYDDFYDDFLEEAEEP